MKVYSLADKEFLCCYTPNNQQCSHYLELLDGGDLVALDSPTDTLDRDLEHFENNEEYV